MDLTALTNLAASLAKAGAPVLSGILKLGATAALGPGAGAVAGMAIDALGEALGVDKTPEAVAEAVATRQDAPAIVATVEKEQAPALMEALTAQLAIVNETARAELQSESPFIRFARPFNIWTIGVVTGGYGLCLVAATAAAVFNRDPAALNLLVANAGVLGIALAPCGAVAGVSAWGRTKEKIEGVAGAVIGAVIKRK